MDIALALVIIVALAAAAMYLSRFMVKRAMRSVISGFRAHKALTAKSAVTAEVLGLGPKGFTDRMFRMRDYRPQAFRLLLQAEIVKVTDDGRVYLSEQALENSAVKKFARIK